MAAVTAALIGTFAFIILRVTAPQMSPLFTDLSVEDSAAIVKDLERQAIPYEIKNDGAIIMVPRDKLTRVRMKLAEGGMPKGGGVGYEIFDKSDTLGATSFVQNINHLGALEPQQIRAIRHLAASAVNGLKPQRVSIVDEAGNLLADGAAEGIGSGGGADGQERQATFERRLREQIESIVSQVVGPGRARVQLSAEFDYNRITETFDKFDPEGRVLRSSQTREESASNDSKEGQVTVGNELPGAQANQQGQPGQAARDQSKKSEEITNYEISRSTKTEVTEGGRVKRISAAVLVDGSYGKNEKGETVYQPRSKEELDRIAALARTAIGFDQKRGDQIEVVNLRFAETPANVIPEPTGLMSFLTFTKDDVMHWIELGVMVLLALVVLLLVVRPLVRRILESESAPSANVAAAIAG